MTGLKTRSVDYTALRGPVTSMADQKKDAMNGSAAAVASRYVSGHGKPGEDDDDHVCRWGSLRPPCCQKFRRPAWFLFWLCWAGAVQGMVVNGFVNVVISTLERRFEISSTESGTIASCYDIASVLCLIPVSYLGGRGRKPVYLALGMFVLGLGSFVFSLPHFTTSLYQMGQAQEVVCRAGTNGTMCDTNNAGLSNYKYVFFLGQLLHGAGASPLYTLGTTYLDENLPIRSTSLYQGIFYAMAIFGPGIGYLAGGAFLSFYTDLDQLDVDTLHISKENPRWVGAWWIGFLISGTIAILVFVPLFGFPKHMPGSEKYRAEKEKEVYKGKDREEEVDSQPLGLRHILVSAKLLLTNPTFMFLNFAAACEGAVVSGFSTFAPKFIEFQFGLTSGTSAQYVGLMAIPAGAGGTFLGGWLVKRFDLDIRKILKFCLAVTAVTMCLCLIFLMYCPNLLFAGISTDYQQSNTNGQYLGSVQLDSSCNAVCGCSQLDYNPVCGRDGVMYYSPCYAGCSTTYDAEGTRFSNCSCVMYNFTADDVSNSQYWQVQEGKCENDCPYLPALLPVLALTLVGIFITSMPALSATLRCVTQDQRSLALGIQWIMARCLGSIPGPILFGKIIDMTCLVWQQSCEGEGTCFYYDNKQMSYNLLGVALGVNFLSCVFFFLALLFYRTTPGSDASVDVAAPDDVAAPSLHTSMTTITQPPTPSSEHPVNGTSFPVNVVGADSDKTTVITPPVTSTHPPSNTVTSDTSANGTVIL